MYPCVLNSAGHNPTKFTLHMELNYKILPILHLELHGNIMNLHSDVFHMKNNYKTPKYKIYLPNSCWIVTFADFHGK